MYSRKIKYFLLTGHHTAPSRFASEDDYAYLERVGYFHDDRHGEDGFGWSNSGDAGWPAEFLGGAIFFLFHDAYYTSLWARQLWRRALHRAQRMLMGERGLAWLAFRAAQTQMCVAFRCLRIEQRICAHAWLPGARAEQAGRLAHLHGAWCAAARRVLECRVALPSPTDRPPEREHPRRRRGRR